MSRETDILALLKEGRKSTSEIANALSMDLSNCSKTLKSYKERGLIVLTPAQEGKKRITYASLPVVTTSGDPKLPVVEPPPTTGKNVPPVVESNQRASPADIEGADLPPVPTTGKHDPPVVKPRSTSGGSRPTTGGQKLPPAEPRNGGPLDHTFDVARGQVLTYLGQMSPVPLEYRNLQNVLTDPKGGNADKHRNLAYGRKLVRLFFELLQQLEGSK